MVAWLIAFLIFVLLAGFPMGGIQETSPQPAAQTEESGDTLVQTAYASHLLPDGWVQSEAHSTSQKNFYVLEGTETEARPDNIAVSVGSCPYGKGEAATFGQAILRQLMRQVGDDVMVSSDGRNTDGGDALLIFNLSASDGSHTTQYYILGEKQFCLIQLTNFSGSDAADAAAEAMAASFQWLE